MNLVTLSRLERNPTVKEELKQKEKEAEALIKKDKERNSSIVKPNYKTNKRKTGLKINPEDV